MDFDEKYIIESMEKLSAPYFYKIGVDKFEGESTGDVFNKVPVRILSNLASDWEDEDLQELVTRHALQNRKVTISFAKRIKVVQNGIDGKEKIDFTIGDLQEAGSFIVNSMDFVWDTYAIFEEHPLALQIIIKTCVSYYMGKLFPSQS